jgi:hypothetical protein
MGLTPLNAPANLGLILGLNISKKKKLGFCLSSAQ